MSSMKNLFLLISKFVALIGLLFSATINTASAMDCEDTNGATGLLDCSIEHDGKTRLYTLIVPENVDSVDIPLVVDMHSYLLNKSLQRFYSGWQSKAEQEGFIVAFPQGVGNSWNAGMCCGDNEEDDVGFIKALVAQVGRNYLIDPEKTFATGFSNGGALSHRLACEASDVFAGIAAAAFPLARVPEDCTPARSINVVHFHGLNDNVVPFGGGGNFNAFPSRDSFQYWSNIKSCQAEPVITYEKNGAVCETYNSCQDNTSNTLCTINGSHLLYNNNDQLNIPDVAWAYLNDAFKGEQEVLANGTKGAFLLWRWVQLNWSSETVGMVDIYRDGELVASRTSEESYRDFVNTNNSSVYQYQICKAGGTDLCSEVFNIKF
ncbi:alpha/beta hydrolase family esterase [Pleionea sediminis]|uniref:alpha/beta hydrolase family esterase n=1 Tax=Pleionea sediminis TaxID=2569479 RepID=UPI00118727DE|nr:PHB depolymerase family esterase [Pleionea sediminis]